MLSKFILFLFVCISWQAKADLRPYYLDIKLTTDKVSMTQGEIIPLWLEFTNTDTKGHTFILPSNTTTRKKIIYFSFFTTVDENDFYTEVFRESVEITIDTVRQKWNNIRNLKAGESFKFPVYFNDEKNFDKHIEAHHRLTNLPLGEYQVLAWYQPWNGNMADQFYNPIGPFGHDDSENPDPNKLDMPTDGLQSNYLTLTLKSSESNLETSFQNTQFCPKNCSFCRKIEKGKWGKVKRTIKRQSSYENRRVYKRTADSTWRKAHRQVAWLGPKPGAILLSLPTWTGRNIIFKNSDGYHFYTLKWQLGKIHKIRSKLAYPFYWMGFRSPPFKTSAAGSCKLVTFKEY